MKELEEIKFYKIPPGFQRDNSAEAEEIVIKMSKARGLLHLDLPFFGFLLSQLEIYPVKDRKVKSFAADSRRLYINASYFQNIETGKMRAILLHAIIHLIMKHGDRGKDKNTQTWGIACDINAHLMVKDALYDQNLIGYQNTTNKKYDIENLNSLPNNFMSKDADAIDDKLFEFAVNHLKEQEKKSSPKTIHFSDEIMQDVLEYTGTDIPCNYVENYEELMSGLPKELVQAEENRMMGMIKYAYEQAKRQGKFPGNFSDYIEELLNPKIPWYTYLEQFIQHSIVNDYQWVPPNRRFIHQDIFLPSTQKENIDVVIALDTSGSISNLELQLFLTESLAIFNSFGNINMTVIQCDTKIQHVAHIEAGENLDGGELPWVSKQIFGRGGTSFIPVFEYIDKKEINASVLLYFTDGFGSFPEEFPNYDTIWIMTTDVQPPFGTLIRYYTEEHRHR